LCMYKRCGCLSTLFFSIIQKKKPTTTTTRSSGGGGDASDSASYLAFIDAALAALVAPVLCCLYALERDLYVFHLLRRGCQRMGRWCLGGEEGKREERVATS
jgi:hypothetical protein